MRLVDSHLPLKRIFSDFPTFRQKNPASGAQILPNPSPGSCKIRFPLRCLTFSRIPNRISVKPKSNVKRKSQLFLRLLRLLRFLLSNCVYYTCNLMFCSLHLYVKKAKKMNNQSINQQIPDPENTLLDPVILTRPSLLYSYIWSF